MRRFTGGGKVLDINRLSRRSTIAGAAWSLVDTEPAWATTPHERLLLTVERVGDIASAMNRQHTDLETEVLELAATALAWVEQMARDGAAA